MTGTGLTSVLIVGLILSPVGTEYYTMFYISGLLSVCALIVLFFFFKQQRYVPNWTEIFASEEELARTASKFEASLAE